ncbi:MAG TPA: cytochrome c oxidase subunit II [Acidimicrobiia bacterium]
MSRLRMKLVGPGKTPYDAGAMVPTPKRWTRLLLLGGMSLFLASCSLFEEVDQPLTTFDPKGPFAEQINGLFWPVFWIAVVVFVLVQGAILLIVLLFRDKGGEKEAKQIHGSPKLEVIWTVIPAIILAVISVPTVSAIFDLTECGSDAMEVEVIGHQWWFEFRYPEEGIQTANVMVIPAGREVCAQMTSDDVIHNFWIPALNGKRYLIPGQTTLLRLQADEPGEFWGHCAEFCGLSHSLMRARVQAVSEADYEAWVEGQLQPAVLPAEGTPEGDGWEIFLSKGCTLCHTVIHENDADSNIVAAGNFEGPNLTHFASRNVFAGAVLPEEGETYDEALKRWLAAPPEIKPGSYMPNLALTEQEIDSLIAWLGSNK